ncbi:sulfatase-like hydrolase/transferase [Agromyces sp. SYSU T0242]|uniref:sulfatase-like hydrolase/transferase n=1 Tax=Agromyces litoreus TaxID=3158561 RepID=UPI003398574A
MSRSASAPRVIVIMTDQHARRASGAYGDPVVQTPNLDALAARGTTYEAASCSSPICVPSRASFMTGRPVHEIGAWDNAHPYRGEPRGWAHALRDAGVPTTVIGKMHFRSAEDDTGFSEVVEPLDVADGVGDIYSLVRDDMPARPALADLVREAGVGESPYLAFDRRVAAETRRFIAEAPADRPWALLVSFATPHHPLKVPQEYWDRYEDVEIELPAPVDAAQHPYVAEMRRVMGVDEAFSAEEVRRARRAYLALCTLADDLVGDVLSAIDERGFDDGGTTVLYTSDHGVSLGERGLWWKHHLHEESVGVPLIAAGPGYAAGARVAQPVSLTSIYPTVLDRFEVADERVDSGPLAGPVLPASDREPTTLAGGFSEYHALGASSAAYQLRDERWKLLYYPTQPPQLFDLHDDPDELRDLAGDPAHAGRLADLIARLRSAIDPEAVDRRARADQARLIEQHGGRDRVLAGGFTVPFTPPPEA